MSRIIIDIDNKACEDFMHLYRIATRQEAVDSALRLLATEPFTLDKTRQFRGAGSDGDREEKRTTVDINDKTCETIMRRYEFATKQEAVNFALRSLAGEPITPEEALQFRGIGWEGDLDEMRTSRVWEI